MPYKGEMKYGRAIGHLEDPKHKFIYEECPDCHKERWVKIYSPKRQYKEKYLCQGCSTKRFWKAHPQPIKPQVKELVELRCPICGETRIRTKEILHHFPDGIGRCNKCYYKSPRPKGEDNPQWKGDNIKRASGRHRARMLIPCLGNCAMCDKPAVERHHKDGNSANNEPCNILTLCRYHHMLVDGRLDKLIKDGKIYLSTHIVSKRPCIICGKPYKPLRKGRCQACDAYLRRTGRERNDSAAHNIKEVDSKPMFSKEV